MHHSRTLSSRVDGHNDARAGASSAQDHGAEVTSRGTLGTRHADLDHLVRQRPFQGSTSRLCR
jgi:hypothetical protein